MKICFFDDEPEIYPLQYGGKARTIINLATEFIKQPMIDIFQRKRIYKRWR